MDAYTDLLDKYRLDPEWKFLGRGQNGSVYGKDGVAVKITTDEVELEHAKEAENKKLSSLTPITNVEIHSPDLGTYQMPIMKPIPEEAKNAINKYNQEITEFLETREEDLIQGLPKSLQKFFQQVRRDFLSAGIPLDETDIQGDNVMVDPSGKLKLIDY